MYKQCVIVRWPEWADEALLICMRRSSRKPPSAWKTHLHHSSSVMGIWRNHLVRSSFRPSTGKPHACAPSTSVSIISLMDSMATHSFRKFSGSLGVRVCRNRFPYTPYSLYHAMYCTRLWPCAVPHKACRTILFGLQVAWMDVKGDGGWVSGRGRDPLQRGFFADTSNEANPFHVGPGLMGRKRADCPCAVRKIAEAPL